MHDPAERLTNLPPYVFSAIAQRIQALAAQGHDIIRLDIGSPDGAPPPAAIEALVRAAQQPDKHGYSGYTGTPTFRQAVASYYCRRFGVTVDPNTQVLLLIGSKEGLVNLCLAFLNPGDIVLVPDLGYPAYARGAMLAGAQVHWLPLRPENGFLPDLEAVPADVADSAKMLWVNYPNNPTGAVADEAFYRQAVNFCQHHNIMLVSDNPYFDITYDGAHAGSVLEIDGATSIGLEMMSFSKTYNMGGWRLGAAVGNPSILKTLLRQKSNIDTGHFMPIYEAGIAALEHTSGEWAAHRNATYQRRRDLVMSALPAAGLTPTCPQGAIYVWARVMDGGGDAYAQAALDEVHVSLTPGHAFGLGGTNYVRISLCTPEEKLEIAMQRLSRWYADNH